MGFNALKPIKSETGKSAFKKWTVTFTVSPDQLRRLDTIARLLGRQRSYVARELLDEAMTMYEKTNGLTPSTEEVATAPPSSEPAIDRGIPLPTPPPVYEPKTDDPPRLPQNPPVGGARFVDPDSVGRK